MSDFLWLHSMGLGNTEYQNNMSLFRLCPGGFGETSPVFIALQGHRAGGGDGQGMGTKTNKLKKERRKRF